MKKFKRILFTLFIFAFMLAQFESIQADSVKADFREAEVVANLEVKEEVKEEKKEDMEKKEDSEEKEEKDMNDVPMVQAPKIINLKDIPEGEKGDAIRDMLARGILKGVSETEFKGELPITRAMVAEVLMRISEDKSVGMVDFKDIKGDEWYADSIAWAVTHGIYQGYPDGSFKANQKVSRQEFATIVSRFLKGLDLKLPEVKSFDYKDASSIAPWSKEAVMQMDKLGLIQGKSEDTYDATSDYLREDLALTLSKIVNHMMARTFDK